MTEDVLEAAAGMYERVAAGHFRERNVPRRGAFAAQGHSGNAREGLDEPAAPHASRPRVG